MSDIIQSAKLAIFCEKPKKKNIFVTFANNMDKVKRFSDILLTPIRLLFPFFVSMGALGVLCILLIPAYDHAPWFAYVRRCTELFLDLYILCSILLVIPCRVRRWIVRFLYIFFYACAIVDMFCFVRFHSTLTPMMIQLLRETNGLETSQFLSTFVTPSLLFTRVGVLILFAVFHLVCSCVIKPDSFSCGRFATGKVALPVVVVLVASLVVSWPYKVAYYKMLFQSTVSGLEENEDFKSIASKYLPVYRFLYSVHTNSVLSEETKTAAANVSKTSVEGCSYTSPQIVLIIGESYNKHHSQLYGYRKATTPRQLSLQQSGQLVAFDNAVAPWNYTSNVFKDIFSLYCKGDKGAWCDYPLFCVLFRKARYHVSFISNQYASVIKDDIYTFTGGAFLNDAYLSKSQFDVRNTEQYDYDDGLLHFYDRVAKKTNTSRNLVIFHLYGQHTSYSARFKEGRNLFHSADYNGRKDLREEERQTVADYDNATLYNDSIVYEIVRRFENDNAIVLYISDHGEDVYDDNHSFGRNIDVEVNAALAHEQYEVPFWIWCSRQYIVSHPDIYAEIKGASRKRFMSDALPHLLVYLAGIHCKYYRDRYNILSNHYDETRPRIINGRWNYDLLMKEGKYKDKWRNN